MPRGSIRPLCSIPDCGRPHHARGWCMMHWKRARVHGELGGLICSITGCNRFSLTRGWCEVHYYHWRNYGDPLYYRGQGRHTPESRLKLSTLNKGPEARERLAAVQRANRTHGMKGTRTYVSWRSMIDRCTYPYMHEWMHYGGAGVTVCERWLRSFENFLADMGERPPDTTLGRFGDVGNYEPGNCAWQTRAEQEAEKRKHREALRDG